MVVVDYYLLQHKSCWRMPTDLEQPAAAAPAGNKFDMADVGYTFSCSYYHIQDCRSMDFGRLWAAAAGAGG